MNAQRKQSMQFVILVLLLCVLGFSGWRMYTLFNPTRRAPVPPPATADAAAQPQQGARTPAPRAEQPAAAGQAGAAAQPPAAGQAPSAAISSSTFPIMPGGQVNSDLFRVYALQPPKNPFIQKEEWYKDKLDTIPGYPEMRDENYFESMDPEFPDIKGTFGEDKDWENISLKREATSQYTLEGSSKDGKYKTTVQLNEAMPEDVELAWTPDSGIPLASLDDAGYVREHLDDLALTSSSTGADGGGLAVPGGEVPPGLAIPGGGATSDATSAALTGTSKGEAIFCTGVSHKGKKTTALMYYNGAPYIVAAGSVLPTHYQVMEIKDDGVVLLELRDGSSKWIPLQQSVPASAK